MSKTENFAKPVNSHLVLFDQPKVAAVKGYIERVFGLILSQYVDGYGCITTNRTVLCDEELNSTWNINDNEDDSLESLHYFKNFPNLSMEDIREVICQTCGTRDLSDSFDDLNKLGAVVPTSDEPLEYFISDSDRCSAWNKDLGSISIGEGWAPLALEKLYNIQNFLKRPIKLVVSEQNKFAQETLCFMQELLNNQFKNGMVVVDIYSNDKEAFANDGIYTYGFNGMKVLMTREEFLAKNPESYEL